MLVIGKEKINGKKKRKKKKWLTRWRLGRWIPIWGVFLEAHCFLSSFLSIRERTFWWVWGEYTWSPLFIFFSLYPTKHISKKFSFLFSLQSFSSTLFHLQTNKFLSSSFKFNHMTVLTRLMHYKYYCLLSHQ